MEQILAFLIIVALGTIVYKLINKHINITWSKIIGIWLICLLIMIFGGKVDSIILFYIGLIIGVIGSLLFYGKMFGKIFRRH